jgi:hypothetical protein
MKQRDWIRDFKEFFESRTDELGTVLDAIGCREGWLQAEAFRFFRSKNVAMYTNYLVLPGVSGKKNRKADFAVYRSDADDAQLDLVAELKVYSERGTYPKGLTGGDLSEVRRRIARTTPLVLGKHRRDRQMMVGPGLMADYFRLVDFDAGDDAPARLLLLCVRRADAPDNFGTMLSKFEFEAAGVTLLDSPSMWVKGWFVGQGHTHG